MHHWRCSAAVSVHDGGQWLNLLHRSAILIWKMIYLKIGTGSNLYQEGTQNCNQKDPSYTGVWQCAKISICEQFMNQNRECIVTRGCATQEQCVNGSSYSNTGGWKGQELTIDGYAPAGMTITISCCKAYHEEDDDAAVIQYADVCNSSAKLMVGYAAAVITLLLSVAMAW